MIYSTPGGIFPTVITVSSEAEAYVLGHPVADGPVNMDYSVVFRIVGHNCTVVRQFPFEITGIACLGGNLFAVDLEADVHECRDGVWRHWRGVGQTCRRINALRIVGTALVGVAGDGMLYEWNGELWRPIVTETPDLYLYDIAKSGDGTVYVSGERGFLAILEDSRLRRVETGMNMDISCVLPLDNGSILLTGRKSTILIGTIQELTQVDVGDRQDAFANAVLWQGTPLIATIDGPLLVTGLIATIHSKQPAHRLASGSGKLIAQHDLGVSRLGEDGIWRDVTLVVEIPEANTGR